jgi:hypothetical protein
MYPSGTTIESLPGILIRVPLTNGVGDELVLGDGVVLEADPAGRDWPAHPAVARTTTDATAEHHSFAHRFFIDVSYCRHPFAHKELKTDSDPRKGSKTTESRHYKKANHTDPISASSSLRSNDDRDVDR